MRITFIDKKGILIADVSFGGDQIGGVSIDGKKVWPVEEKPKLDRNRPIVLSSLEFIVIFHIGPNGTWLRTEIHPGQKDRLIEVRNDHEVQAELESFVYHGWKRLL